MSDKLTIADNAPRKRLPEWLHRKLPKGDALANTHRVIDKHRLHTVCEEARCPNITECFSKKTATFLVMGKECTRACGFCDIDFSKTPRPLDPREPEHIAQSVQELGLRHVVITMVARDDLADGGAAHLVAIVKKLREGDVTVELLTSDLQENYEALRLIADEKPDIFNHNIETVRRLSPRVRHKATYDRSLSVLRFMKSQGLLVKSGIMVGLGESEEEVLETLGDLQRAGCDIVTIGQYLKPSSRKLQVQDYIHPDTFKKYEVYGHSLGITYVYAGPFVRSSYNANVVIKQANDKLRLIQST